MVQTGALAATAPSVITSGAPARLCLAVLAWLLSGALGLAATVVFSSGDAGFEDFDTAVGGAGLHLAGTQAIASPGDYLQAVLQVALVAPGVAAGDLFPGGTDEVPGVILRTNAAGDLSGFLAGGNLLVTGALAPGEPAFIGSSSAGDAIEVLAVPSGFSGLVRAVDVAIRPDGDRPVELVATDAAGVVLASAILPAGTRRAGVVADDPGLLRVSLRVVDGYAEISSIAVHTSAGPADAVASVIDADPLSGLLANGIDASQITIAVRDSAGRLRAGGGGSEIHLATDLGTLGTLAEGGDGLLTASLVADIPGTATVTARLGPADAGESIGSVAVVFDPDPDAPPPELTIAVDDVAKWAGDGDPDFTVRYSGFLPGDDSSVLEGVLTLARESGEAPGAYEITASGLTAEGYTIRYLAGTMVIEPASAVRIHGSVTGFDLDVAARNLHFLGEQEVPTPGTGGQVVLPGASVFPGQAAGVLFPSGSLAALGLTIQTNSGGSDAGIPLPGGALLVSGPLTDGGQALIGASSTDDSLDLLLNPAGFQGLVRAVDFAIGSAGGEVVIKVFDNQNQLLGSKVLPVGVSHAGVVMPVGTFVRVNIHAEGGVDLGDISIHTAAGPAAVEACDFEVVPLGGLVANGSDSATVRVTVRDAEGRLRDGVEEGLVVETDLGDIGPWLLTEEGVREAVFTSTVAGNATVAARLNGPDGSVTIGAETVVFDPDPALLPVDLTVTAANAFKWAGDPDPPFPVVYEGFKPGEDAAVLDGSLLAVREPGEEAGFYTVTPSGISSTAYNIIYLPGVLEIRSPAAAYFDWSADGTQNRFDSRLTGAGYHWLGRQSMPSPGIGVSVALPSAIFPGEAAGIWFPQGSGVATGITIQTNRLGGASEEAAPGGGLTLAGPSESGSPALLGPSNAGDSLDLIIGPPGSQRLLRAVALSVRASEGIPVQVRLYDNANVLIDQFEFPAGTRRIGITTDRADVVRINLHASGGFFEVGEIDVYSSAGALDAEASSVEVSRSAGLVADGADASVLTVTSRDAEGRVREGAGDVFFVTTTLGSVSTFVDHGDGTLTASLTSRQTGTATLEVRLDDAVSGPLVGTASVVFDSLPLAANISRPAAVLETLPFTGSTMVGASILSATGSPVPGVAVLVGSDPSSRLVHPVEVVSDAEGLVEFEVFSAATEAGEVTLTLSIDGDDANVAADASVGVTLTIEPKGLRVIAEDKTKITGEPDPVFSVVYEGFVPGDDESVLGGGLVILREPGESPGTYRITPGGLTSDSYVVDFISGNLVIGEPPFADVFDSALGESETFAAAVDARGYYLLGRQTIPSPGVFGEAVLAAASVHPGESAGPLFPAGTEERLGLVIRSNREVQGFVEGGVLVVSGPADAGDVALIGPAGLGDALDVVVDPPGVRGEVRGVSFVVAADATASVSVSILDRNNTVLDAFDLEPGVRFVGFLAGEAGMRRLSIRADQGYFGIGDLGVYLARGPLVAREDELFFSPSSSSKYHVSQLLANDVDLEGADLSILAVSPSSDRGGSLAMDGSWIQYSPPDGGLPAGFDDAFSVTVSNGASSEVTRARLLQVPAPERIAGNLVSLSPLASGGVRALFAGIPGFSYTIQASSDLVSWSPIGTVTADAQGRIIVEDANAGAARFYRFGAVR